MQDFVHRRCLPRFGFPLTSRHASVDAASAGAATQSTPSGGALTNSRLPSSSTSRYPAVHASVERSLRCEKPLAAIRLPANAASALAHKLAVGMLPCPITPLSTSADAIAVNASRKPRSAALPIASCAGTLRAPFFLAIRSPPFCYSVCPFHGFYALLVLHAVSFTIIIIRKSCGATYSHCTQRFPQLFLRLIAIIFSIISRL